MGVYMSLMLLLHVTLQILWMQNIMTVIVQGGHTRNLYAIHL